MALNSEQKKAIVAEVADVASSAYSAIAAEYRGLTVEDLTELRKQARSNSVYLRVVKNTLAKRAVAGTDFECMREGFKGPLVLAFSQEDPGAAARVINDFGREHDDLVVRMVSISGKLLDPAEIEVLAKMPTYEQAVSMLMATMMAPVQKLAATLNEIPGKLVRTVAAIRDAKEAG